MARLDLTGQKFGKLAVLRIYEKKGERLYWECSCDCGKTTNVATSKLRSGWTRSCGCARGKWSITHHMSNTRPTKIWNAMKQRCNNPKTINYKRYGGNGITVCEKWLRFEGFWEDMKEGYADDLSIDRIDGSKGYYKDNCKWSTVTEQARNRKSNRLITFEGETKSIAFWAEKYNLKQLTLLNRINKGWDVETALTKKVR